MVITSLLPWNWKKYTSAPWNNRQSAFNAIEKAYRKANSISRIAMSLDDWVMVAEAFLAIAIPDITGWPERLTIPIIFFVLQCGWLSIRRQDQWFQEDSVDGASVLPFLPGFDLRRQNSQVGTPRLTFPSRPR